MIITHKPTKMDYKQAQIICVNFRVISAFSGFIISQLQLFRSPRMPRKIPVPRHSDWLGHWLMQY